MAFDVKEMVEDIVEKIKKDPKLLSEFKDDPAKVLSTLTGLSIPEEQLQAVITAVKAKITTDDVADKLGALGKFLK